MLDVNVDNNKYLIQKRVTGFRVLEVGYKYVLFCYL